IQRWSDLRWKRGEMALRLVDQALTYPPSAAALELLDEHSATYRLERGAPVSFTHDDVKKALLVQPVHFDSKSSQVRHCFDALFYYFDRFEQHIKSRALCF